VETARLVYTVLTRSGHSLNISEMAKDTAIVTMEAVARPGGLQ